MIERGNGSEIWKNPAEFAVADAMMVAQIHLIHAQARIDRYKEQERHGIQLAPEGFLSYSDDFLERATKRKCNIGSEYAARSLYDKHLPQFNSLLLIRATGKGDNFRKRGWRFHEAFLAEGSNGVWYAGSPAGFDRNDPQTRLTQVHHSTDLTTLIQSMTEADNVRWPTAQFIKNSLEGNIWRLPRPRIDAANPWNSESSNPFIARIDRVNTVNALQDTQKVTYPILDSLPDLHYQ